MKKKEIKKTCFDNELYLKLQSENINKRIKKFNNKLYLELGGKIFDDLHASRVLPGFDPNIKIKLLQKMKDKVEIVLCISANDIEKNRIRADLGLNYADEVLRLVDNMRELNLYVSSFVITLFKGQSSAQKFAQRLEQRGEKVYFHHYTKGYPNDVETIVSDEGYGANPYIETTRPLVVVTAPGPSSGKLATCLSQLYHEHKRGMKAGYAKYETFPVWNLPLKHPVNIAYEAATADLNDVNQIDPFHFNAYGTLAINYNRDIAVFPILQNILQKEILRRYYRAECDYKKGQITFDNLERNKSLVSEVGVKDDIFKVIGVARQTAKDYGYPTVALELPSGQVVTGKSKKIITASGAVILNALRTLAGLGDDFDIITDDILLPIVSYRTNILKSHCTLLTVDDILVALSICSAKNEKAKKALDGLPKLHGCEAHATYILPSSEETTLKKLGINITCDPVFVNNNLFEY